jgi:hypothetical protein
MPEIVVPSATVNPAIAFSNFIQANFIWIVLLIVGAFGILYFVRIRSKQPKTINRNQVEKHRRIEELRYTGRTIKNITNLNGLEIKGVDEYRNIFHGRIWLGEISNITERTEEITSNGKKEEKEILEMVFRPKWFWNFASPFRKDLLRVFKDCVVLDSSRKNIVILPTISIDGFMGYYYDVPNEKTHTNWVNDQIFKHDKEDTTSFYYVESQKRSTFDLEFAHDMAMKEKELQVELARKRGKMTSI